MRAIMLPLRRFCINLKYSSLVRLSTTSALYTRGTSSHTSATSAECHHPWTLKNDCSVTRQTTKNQLDFIDIGIDQSLSRFSLLSLQSQLQKKYHVTKLCQGRGFSEEILDPLSKTFVDCPTISHLTTIGDPLTNSKVIADPLVNPKDHQMPGVDHDITSKEASTGKGKVIRKRRRKMKRHQYKKFLKRTRFLRWRLKQARERRRLLRWQKYLESLKFKKLYARDIRQEIKKKQEEWAIYQNYVEYMKQNESSYDKATVTSGAKNS